MRAWRAVMAVMWAGLAACGGPESDDKTPIDGPVERGDFNAKAVEAVCDRSARCGRIDDRERCQAQGLSWGFAQVAGLGTRYDEALAAGRIRYDAEVAGQCVKALREGSCDEDPMSLPMRSRGIEYDTRCRFLQGQVAEGAACEWSTECQDGAYCDATALSCGGVCRRGTVEETGAAFDSCPPGTFVYGGSQRCLTPGEEGAPCGSAPGEVVGICDRGLWCDAPDASTPGTCKRMSTEGEACDDSKGPQCGWSLLCRDGRCQKYRGRGAACTAPGNSRSGRWECRAELFCDGESGQPGTCRPRLAAGASCRHDQECEDDMDCTGAKPLEGVRGTCQPLPRQGEACDSQFSCAPGFLCSNNSQTCVPSARLGEPCADTSACYFVNGWCVDGICRPQGAQSCP